MKQYIFGIDIGGTTVKIGLFSEEGFLAENREIVTRKDNAGEQILPDISRTLEEMMTKFDLYPCGLSSEITDPANKKGVVSGVGLAVPGAVLHGTEVKPCVNLNGWGGKDVAKELSALIHAPVAVLNDANAAALGEQWKGSGQGYSNLIFVTLGTGIGGGVIVNGKLIAGVHGSAGEIGHIKLFGADDEPAENCGCGKKGCAEQFGSATGLVRLAEKHGYSRKSDMVLKSVEEQANPKRLTAREVMHAALSGTSEEAQNALDEFADKLGRMLANVSCVVDPEVFIIGGGVSNAGQPMIDKILPAFRKYAFPASEETGIVLAELGNDSGMYGAARYFLTS